MEKKKVKCPRCKEVFEVVNSGNSQMMLITCPNQQCGARMRLTFATGETVLAGYEPNEKEIGQIEFHGKKYPLQEGLNTIGRHSQSGKATIQLETNDLTMSRMHAQIDVRRLKNGRVKAVLSDLREAKKAEVAPMIMDDEKLFPEDAVVLANGDVITLGHTKVKYRR